MRSSVYLAAIAAIPSTLAQVSDVTSASTVCTTRFWFNPGPTGSAIPTLYSFATTTNTFLATTTTCNTTTITPSATVLTGIVTETATVSITSTSVPPAVNVPTPASFLPLVIAAPTNIARVKRAEQVEVARKRQTPPGNEGGFSVDGNGVTSNLRRAYPHQVRCNVLVTVNTTSSEVVVGGTETVTLPQSTASAVVTTTISTTQTVTVVAPTPTNYAACAINNVVNHLTDNNGSRINFNRVIYQPAAGFPMATELVTNKTSAVDCCVACQTTVNCAGSIYAPSRQQCRIRLTQAPSNSTLPIGTASAPFPTATGKSQASNVRHPEHTLTDTGTSGTCTRGSNSLFIGDIRGEPPSQIPDNVALFFSNGQCGRFTVDVRDLPFA